MRQGSVCAPPPKRIKDVAGRGARERISLPLSLSRPGVRSLSDAREIIKRCDFQAVHEWRREVKERRVFLTFSGVFLSERVIHTGARISAMNIYSVLQR